MGWQGVANAIHGLLEYWTTGLLDYSFLQPGNFSAIFDCCFIFVDTERSPGILAQLNLGLCYVLETSIFSCTYIVHLIGIA